MSPDGRALFVAVFEHEDDIVAAAATARERGYHIEDAYTPYAVHGLDRAMGLPPSRLTWACFGAGLLGLLCAVGLQVWTSSIDWPIIVGGKPHNSMPAFVPVAFEMTVLFAGLGAAAALLLRVGLLPGRKPVTVAARTTDDRFALALAPEEAAFNPAALAALMREHGAVETRYPVVAGTASASGGAPS